MLNPPIESIFGQGDVARDNTLKLPQTNIRRISGAPSGNYPDGTIFLNTAENRLYIALNKSDAVATPDAAWWKFDESSGNASDSSGNSHTAVNTNVSFVSGKYNNAADFTGAGNYFTVTEHADLNFADNFTVEFWLYITDKTPASPESVCYRMKDINDEVFIGIHPLSYLYIIYNAGGTSATIYMTLESVNENEWHHYAFVRNKTEGTMLSYIDGQLKNTVTCHTSNPTLTGYNFFIGVTSTHKMDDLKLWKIARTTRQIKTDMARPSTIQTSWLYVALVPV